MALSIYEVASLGAGRLSGMAMPISDEQFEELRRQGVDHVVSLLDVDEQIDVGLAEEGALCDKNGMRFTCFPIVDRDVPQKNEALALAAALRRDIDHGEHIAIHCRAGVGRTGMMASAVLMQAGFSASEAIHAVSWARGGLIPDTEEQDRWIRSLQHRDNDKISEV